MIEKMKKRDELTDRFVGRNILIPTMCTNILSLSGPQKRFNNIIFNKMQVTEITENFDIILRTENDRRITIKENVVSEVFIDNINQLRYTLKKFFDGDGIEIVDIVEDYDFPDVEKYMIYKSEKKNIKDITTLKIKTNGNIEEKNSLDYIPASKMEITKNKPILFQFASRRDTFEIREIDNIGYRDFEKSCFYGYNELDKAIDDICKHYSQFLPSEDESNNKNSNIFKKLKNVFKKN